MAAAIELALPEESGRDDIDIRVRTLSLSTAPHTAAASADDAVVSVTAIVFAK